MGVLAVSEGCERRQVSEAKGSPGVGVGSGSSSWEKQESDAHLLGKESWSGTLNRATGARVQSSICGGRGGECYLPQCGKQQAMLRFAKGSERLPLSPGAQHSGARPGLRRAGR